MMDSRYHRPIATRNEISSHSAGGIRLWDFFVFIAPTHSFFCLFLEHARQYNYMLIISRGRKKKKYEFFSYPENICKMGHCMWSFCTTAWQLRCIFCRENSKARV